MAEMDDTEDYQPSMTSIKVKHGGKGKGKMVERRRKGERKMRAWKPPQSTGILREKPCKRCICLKTPCYNQVKGVVCVGCAVVKMKCDDIDGEEKAQKLDKRKRPKVGAASKDQRPANTRPMRMPATQQKSMAVKLLANLPALLEDSNLLTISPICSSVSPPLNPIPNVELPVHPHKKEMPNGLKQILSLWKIGQLAKPPRKQWMKNWKIQLTRLNVNET